MVRTLLVEGDGPFRSMLKTLLLQRFPQLEIEVSGDGEEALRLAEVYDPDLVFMDIRLPDGNGLDFAANIKASHSHAVVVVLSGHDLPEYRNVVQRFSVDLVLSKDASLDSVYGLVEGILREHHSAK